MEIDEEVVVTCDCCGLEEDCTQFYISEVKAKFEGKWLCGLCSEAVRDEEAKRIRIISGQKPFKVVHVGLLEEAVNAHMSFCRKFKANPAIRVADGMRLMLRRRSSDVSASSSSSSSSGKNKYARSTSSSQTPNLRSQNNFVVSSIVKEEDAESHDMSQKTRQNDKSSVVNDVALDLRNKG